jgi:uncharacterized protein
MKIKKYTLVVMIMVLSLSFALSGCGNQKQGENDKKEVKQVSIKIATGNTGGTYYPVGVAMGQLFSEKIPGAVSSAMSTGGSVDNIGLLVTNEAQIATMMETVVEDAYYGVGVFEGKKNESLRAITSLWPNLNHIVVHKNIKSFEDLKGKKFVVGAARSGTETDSYAILSSLGLYYRDEDGAKKNVTPVWINYAEAVEQMKNLQVAGGLFNAYPPGSSITDLLSTGDFHVLSLTSEQISTISKNYPLYSSYTVPAGTYPKQTEEFTITGYPNLIVTTTQVDEETVYNMTKTIFENTDFLVSAHKASELIKLDTATMGIKIPFHDGAKRYLEEKGAFKK